MTFLNVASRNSWSDSLRADSRPSVNLRFKKTDLSNPFKPFLKDSPSLKIDILGFKGLFDSLWGFPGGPATALGSLHAIDSSWDTDQRLAQGHPFVDFGPFHGTLKGDQGFSGFRDLFQGRATGRGIRFGL